MSSLSGTVRGGSRPRRLLPRIIGGVCALIALIVAIALVLGAVWYFALRQTPESVMEEYFAVWEAADCERFEELTTDNFRGEDHTCEGWMQIIEREREEGFEFEHEIEGVEVDGDRATVRVRETMTDGATVHEGVYNGKLLRENGTWLLDDFEDVQEFKEI